MSVARIRDEILRGEEALFSNWAAFKQLCYIMLPLCALVHLLTIFATVRDAKRNEQKEMDDPNGTGNDEETYVTRLDCNHGALACITRRMPTTHNDASGEVTMESLGMCDYFTVPRDAQRWGRYCIQRDAKQQLKPALLTILEGSRCLICVCALLGAVLMVFNLTFPQIYDPLENVDPLIRTTISPVAVVSSSGFQWAWFCGTCALQAVVSWFLLLHREAQHTSKYAAHSMLQLLQHVEWVLREDCELAFRAWKQGYLREAAGSRAGLMKRLCACIAMELCLFALMTAPEVGYILAQVNIESAIEKS